MQDDDLFVSNLTIAEFFALPEAEQARLWHEAHRAAEHELDSMDSRLQSKIRRLRSPMKL